MTIAKRRPGEGYLYFKRQTVAGDVHRIRGEGLADSLARAALPQGQWVGRAADTLGVLGPVAEPELKALFGEGLHPRADQLTAAMAREGRTVAQIQRGIRLGARFGHYRPSPLKMQLTQAVAEAERSSGRRLRRDEEEDLLRLAASRAFLSDFGRPAEGSQELARYTARQLRAPREPVAAFALVMSGPASFQHLWALGDEATAAAAEQCHDAAVADTVAWIEKHALAVRTGAGGVAQKDVTGGLIAVRFRHFDSRTGDPQLHDHLEIANKVQDPDRPDRWLAIDGRWLFAQTVAISEFFNQRLLERVCQTFVVRATARTTTAGKRPVMEIEGIDPALNQVFGHRRTQIASTLEHLIEDYRRAYGHEPASHSTRLALMRRAQLATRPTKKSPTPLTQLRARWRAAAVNALGEERVDALLRHARLAHNPNAIDPALPATNQAGAAWLLPEPATCYPGEPEQQGCASASLSPGPVEVDIAAAATAVVKIVGEHRAVFAERHLQAEARRRTVLLTRGHPALPDLAERITAHAVALCLPITAPDVHTAFPATTRPDGTSVYRRRGSQLFTTPANLEAERFVVNAANTPAIPAATHALFDRHAGAHSRLNPGQLALARSFACSEKAVAVAVGPAGSGKTSALRLVAETVRAAGGNLVALAPSSRAAQVLAQDLGQDATTLHRWLHAQERAAHGHPIHSSLQLHPGDVVVVDEAGMAGNHNLARITDYALRAGAHVRLVGDPAQLSAVEAGGILRWLATLPSAVHLTALHRFTTPGEADASLQLREGDPAAIAWYHQQERLHGGDLDHMADKVFIAWSTDQSAGRISVMLAPNSETVTALNARAQDWLRATGRLGARGPVLRDGNHAHVGDTIVTRRNERTWTTLAGKDFVKNGDTWLIEGITATGEVRVRHTTHRGRATLPTHYLRTHTELGYASTVHRCQGITVQTAHALLLPDTSREAAYVAATRGSAANHLYLASPNQQTPVEVLTGILHTTTAARSAHQAHADVLEAAVSFTQLAAEYADTTDRADTVRITARARQALGAEADLLITADAWPLLQRVLVRAERTGWTTGRLLQRTRLYNPLTDRFGPGGSPFTTADEPAALMLWRIEKFLAQMPETQDLVRPLAVLTDQQLSSLAARADEMRVRALSGAWYARPQSLLPPPNPQAAPGPTPDWHRTSARAAADAGDHLGARAHLAAADHLQQHPPAPPAATASGPESDPGTALDLARAHESAHYTTALLQRITAEQRLRRDLPDTAPAAADHTGPVPTWLADPAAFADPSTPAHWRTHLGERRRVLADRLAATGSSLATTTPAWLHPLGAPPPPDATALRRTWEHAAAMVAAWRALHRTPTTSETLGTRPENPEHSAAFDALTDHLTAVARLTRAHHDTMARSNNPDMLRQDLREHLAAIGGPAPDWGTSRPPGPTVLPALVLPPVTAVQSGRSPEAMRYLLDAEAFAATVLHQVLAGQTPSTTWIGHIPAPDRDDEDQQTLFKDLVAALANWRQRYCIPEDEPLGPEPAHDQDLPEWQHLTQALHLYQQSRIRERLALIHARHTADPTRPDHHSSMATDRTNHRPPPGIRPPLPSAPSTANGQRAQRVRP